MVELEREHAELTRRITEKEREKKGERAAGETGGTRVVALYKAREQESAQTGDGELARALDRRQVAVHHTAASKYEPKENDGFFG